MQAKCSTGSVSAGGIFVFRHREQCAAKVNDSNFKAALSKFFRQLVW